MAMDPFSAASKPLPPPFILHSKQPLPFAATLTGGALLAPFEMSGESISKGKGKRPQDRIPNIPASSSATSSPMYLHKCLPSQTTGTTSTALSLDNLKLSEENAKWSPGRDGRYDTVPEVGSDEWMNLAVAKCVDKASLTLDLSGHGLTYLSDQVSGLQNLVTLPSRSPAPPPYIDTPAHPDSPRHPNPSSPQWPGSTGYNGRLSPNVPPVRSSPQPFAAGRTFQRYASAPSGSLGVPSHAQARMREMSGGALTSSSSFSGSDAPDQQINIASGLPSTSTLNTRPFRRVPSKGFAPPGSAVEDEEEVELLWDGSQCGPASPATTGFKFGTGASLLRPPPVPPELGASSEALPSRAQRRPTSSGQLFARKVSFQAPSASPDSVHSSGEHRRRPSLGQSPSETTAADKPTPSSPETRRRLRATSSAPASGLGSPQSTTLGGEAIKTRAFLRTASGTHSPALNGKWAGQGNGDIVLTLANNALTALPSALFQITNLVVLSLRHNRLTALPAAIGQLCNLKELNLGNNKIETFPPTLLDLNLDNFYFPMNPLKKPGLEALEQVPSGRRLGPISRHSTSPTSLRSLCISVLLSSRGPDGLPPFLTETDWEPIAGSRDPHGLRDAVALQETIKELTLDECQIITTSLRSSHRALKSASRRIKHSIPDPSYSPSSRPRKSAGQTASDDASKNVYYSPCPNPSHTPSNAIWHAESQGTTRWIYAHEPAEQRIEWTNVAGTGEAVPILWKGCSPGCLRFLEEADTEEEDEGEATETDEQDGFGADVLYEPWS